MTVPTQDTSSGPYTGNGIADTFAYDFGVSSKNDLRVVQTDTAGTQTVLTVDTDYTVTGVGNENGGDVITTSPLAAGYKLLIRSDISPTQLTDFESQGAFFPGIHEDAFDKLTRLIQQLRYDNDRTLRIDPDIEFAEDLALAVDAANRANRVIGFDENGNIRLFTPSEGGIASVTVSFYDVAAGQTVVPVAAYEPNTQTQLYFLNSAPIFEKEGALTETNATTVTLANAPSQDSKLAVLTLPFNNIGTADSANISHDGKNLRDEVNARVPSYLVSEVAALTGPVGKNIIIADRDHSIWEAVAPGSPDGYSRLAGNGVDWVLAETGSLTVRMFGAVGDGVADDTAAIQAAADYGSDNLRDIHALGGPYKITALNLACRIIGDRTDRFGVNPTFTSDVSAGTFAIRLLSTRGALESVTLVTTSTGNGIDANLVSTRTAMKDVAVVRTSTLSAGDGSIGVMYGTDATPGEQAITAVFDTVSVRGYDICHYMGFYSNSNIYRNMYALNTTTGAATRSSHGFYIRGRGGHYDKCIVESNFEVSLETTGDSQYNTFTNYWAEGTADNEVILNGQSNLMINPFNVTGLPGGAIPLTVGAYSKVVRSNGPAPDSHSFEGFSGNLVRNAGFAIDLGGLNWGTKVQDNGATMLGFNAVDIVDPATSGTITADHLMSYIDLDVHTWLRGKTITMSCFGQAESGVSMSLRGIIRNAAGSNIQYGTSANFDTSAPSIAKISLKIPSDPADSRYIVFRIFASNVPTGGAGLAGRIANPSVFLGKELDALEERRTGDGANTFYGNQTLHGGGWNQAHIVLGTNHLWVDSTGDLRIKNGAPASDTDGTVVGTQT